MEYKTTIVFSRYTLFFLGPSPPSKKTQKNELRQIIR